jgi:hypothetical protein
VEVSMTRVLFERLGLAEQGVAEGTNSDTVELGSLLADAVE